MKKNIVFALFFLIKLSHASETNIDIWLNCQLKISTSISKENFSYEKSVILNVIDRYDTILKKRFRYIIPTEGFFPVSNHVIPSEYEFNSYQDFSDENRWELYTSHHNKITGELRDVHYLIHRSAGTLSYSVSITNLGGKNSYVSGLGNCEKIDSTKNKF